MGEAKQRRDREATIEAAYRLGGVEALFELVAPDETIACPVCKGDGLVLETTRARFNDMSLTPESATRAKPVRSKVVCFVCSGKGGLRRLSVHPCRRLISAPMPRRYR